MLRGTLYFSLFYNLMGAVTFFLPASLGQAASLPVTPPYLYNWFVAGNIGLFGLVSGWLARQPVIDRPLLVVFGISKIQFFVVMLASHLAGEVSAIGVALSGVDLVMGLIFLRGASALRRVERSHVAE